jgi:hypothetical protein
MGQGSGTGRCDLITSLVLLIHSNVSNCRCQSRGIEAKDCVDMWLPRCGVPES